MYKSLSQSAQAVLVAIIAYGSFSNADAINKLLTKTYSVPTTLMAGSLIAVVVCGLWILWGRGVKGFFPPTLKWQALRSLIVCVSSFSAVTGIKHLNLPVFYSIIFLAPIAVILLSAALGHEKLRFHRLITVVMGFIGVLIIVGVQFRDIGFGAAMTFICVICSSLSVMTVRKIGQHDYAPVYCFFPCFTIFMASAPLADWGAIMSASARDLALYLGFGLFMIIGHITIPLAYAKAPQASLVAPVFYTQMLWGIAYGMILFGQMPKISTLIGSSLIISGGLYMIWKEKRRPRAPINTEVIMDRD